MTTTDDEDDLGFEDDDERGGRRVAATLELEPEMDAGPRLDIRLEAEKLRALYKNSPQTDKMHGLIIAEKGVGKTSIISTCPKPVLIHSFDPDGTAVLKEEIASGDVIADVRFEVDDLRKPVAYTTWETEFNRLGRLGFFKSLGTYVLDSSSTFCTAMLWQIMNKEKRLPAGMNIAMDDAKQGMRIQDWGTVLNNFVMVTRSISALPCHTLILGHIGREKDEITQGFVNTFMVAGQAKDQVPILLSESYVLMKRIGKGGKDERVLLTENDGRFRASTRMGRKGIFARYEPADIRALLKKAGYPYEDLPKL